MTCRADGLKVRHAIGGWQSIDVLGNPLHKSSLSGRLLAVEGFMGTICDAQPFDYLLNKINGVVGETAAQAKKAQAEFEGALIPLIRDLHPKDFELLVDLLFTQGGWQRVGVTGGTERDVDLDLILPVTGERVAVQVKSRAGLDVWRTYEAIFRETPGYHRFYFVTHHPDQALRAHCANLEKPVMEFWGAEEIAARVVQFGLVGWLFDKAV